MALALGEGSEQSAPLSRAVIGGLLVATMMTLFVVPTVCLDFQRPLETEARTRCRGRRRQIVPFIALEASDGSAKTIRVHCLPRGASASSDSLWQ